MSKNPKVRASKSLEVSKKSSPSLEGFLHYMLSHRDCKQSRYLKFAIRRLSKEYPEADPRTVLVEWLAQAVADYEKHIEFRSRGWY
jgi:hypothetical protein